MKRKVTILILSFVSVMSFAKDVVPLMPARYTLASLPDVDSDTVQKKESSENKSTPSYKYHAWA